MALHGVGVGHGPALAVLVDERLAIVADLSRNADSFAHLVSFHVVLFHVTRFSAFLRERQKRCQERKRQRHQYQLFHAELLSERTALGGTFFMWVPAFHFRPYVARTIGFWDRTSVLFCSASGQ